MTDEVKDGKELDDIEKEILKIEKRSDDEVKAILDRYHAEYNGSISDIIEKSIYLGTLISLKLNNNKEELSEVMKVLETKLTGYYTTGDVLGFKDATMDVLYAVKNTVGRGLEDKDKGSLALVSEYLSTYKDKTPMDHIKSIVNIVNSFINT